MKHAMKNFTIAYQFENPWEGGPKKSNPQKGASQEDPSKELEEMLKKGRTKIMDFLSSKNDSGGGFQYGSKPGVAGKSWGWIFFIIIILFALLAWLSTGFYTIDTDEQGVVIRFGRYNRISTPGLNWKLPSPVETVEKVSVTRINKEVIGFKASQNQRAPAQESADDSISIPKESQMLTGDENIMDLHFSVQWYIKDPSRYLFNIRDDIGENTIRVASESAMRQVVGLAKISEALSEQRQGIEHKAKAILQNMLDSYNSGIEVVSLGILYSYVAPEVRDAYRDIQSAKADKEREINQAQAYKNDIIPRARGSAQAIIQEAMAYKDSVVARAQGEAERFSAVVAQYQKAKDVTRKNMYINTMEQVLKNKEKVLIDKRITGNGTIPVIPMKDLFEVNKN